MGFNTIVTMATAPVKQGTPSWNSRTRASGPSVPIFPSKQPCLYSLSLSVSVNHQVVFVEEKSPTLSDLTLSLRRLLPVLSQLKVKGCKSVAGFYDLVFLCTPRRPSHTGPGGIFALYVFRVLRFCCNSQSRRLAGPRLSFHEQIDSVSIL